MFPFNFKKKPLKKTLEEKLQPHLTKVSSGFTRPDAPPDELLGELFQDVQLRRVHADGKTFVDLVPSARLRKILKIYKVQRLRPDFDLKQFVQRYFQQYIDQAEAEFEANPANTPEQHINELWTVLRRTTYKNRGSLMALPYPYIVPGGRFSEQFYWDTYFIMLGLATAGRYDEIEGMLKNYAFLIRKVGYIPTASRTYLLSRSQPPFFAAMVRLLAEEKGKSVMVRYLPYLLKEYNFWMKGAKELSEQDPALNRVVRMPDGAILNRYYDKKRTPRPESYKEDVETAHRAHDRSASRVYLDLRAGAESGWDYSSRWFRDGKTLETIHTTEIIPVDLNCLLYDLEKTIADTYSYLRQSILAKRFLQRAERRAEAIRKYCWSEKHGFYFDYDFVASQQTSAITLAGVFPLYVGIAQSDEAEKVQQAIKKQLLRLGGVVTTPVNSGQQWDAPNGWAPLQWTTIIGLRRYGHHKLADEIKKRWITTNVATYELNTKLVEKYDVEDPTNLASGGEYELQDGFGWTNGVLLALLNDRDR
ncbi:MAG TPA: alpha,alpha-trehalase TreF [Verrucomicrobiae bacterium]|nr:alpha,alpha-trehalase TreF [Verrucomicrobiae bacterium]